MFKNVSCLGLLVLVLFLIVACDGDDPSILSELGIGGAPYVACEPMEIDGWLGTYLPPTEQLPVCAPYQEPEPLFQINDELHMYNALSIYSCESGLRQCLVGVEGGTAQFHCDGCPFSIQWAPDEIPVFDGQTVSAEIRFDSLGWEYENVYLWIVDEQNETVAFHYETGTYHPFEAHSFDIYNPLTCEFDLNEATPPEFSDSGWRWVYGRGVAAQIDDFCFTIQEPATTVTSDDGQFKARLVVGNIGDFIGSENWYDVGYIKSFVLQISKVKATK